MKGPPEESLYGVGKVKLVMIPILIKMAKNRITKAQETIKKGDTPKRIEKANRRKLANEAWVLAAEKAMKTATEQGTEMVYLSNPPYTKGEIDAWAKRYNQWAPVPNISGEEGAAPAIDPLVEAINRTRARARLLAEAKAAPTKSSSSSRARDAQTRLQEAMERPREEDAQSPEETGDQATSSSEEEADQWLKNKGEDDEEALREVRRLSVGLSDLDEPLFDSRASLGGVPGPVRGFPRGDPILPTMPAGPEGRSVPAASREEIRKAGKKRAEFIGYIRELQNPDILSNTVRELFKGTEDDKYLRDFRDRRTTEERIPEHARSTRAGLYFRILIFRVIRSRPELWDLLPKKPKAPQAVDGPEPEPEPPAPFSILTHEERLERQLLEMARSLIMSIVVYDRVRILAAANYQPFSETNGSNSPGADIRLVEALAKIKLGELGRLLQSILPPLLDVNPAIMLPEEEYKEARVEGELQYAFLYPSSAPVISTLSVQIPFERSSESSLGAMLSFSTSLGPLPSLSREHEEATVEGGDQQAMSIGDKEEASADD